MTTMKRKGSKPTVVLYGRTMYAETATKCEFMLMGKVQTIETPETNTVVHYLLNVLKVSKDIDPEYERYADNTGDFLNEVIRKYSKTNSVWGVVCNTLNFGEPCRTVTFLLEKPDPANTSGGAVYVPCYVLNLDWGDMGSEFGDCFFQKRGDHCWHRVS